MRSVLSNAHLTAVLNAVDSAAPAYDGTDNQHIAELMDFVHAAYYLKSYNPADPTLFTLAATKAAGLQALGAFAASPHVDDFDQSAADILYDWVTAVDGAVLADAFYAELVSVLHVFNTEPSRWPDYYQGSAVWATIAAVFRQILINPAFSGSIDQTLLTELSALATNVALPTETTYLASNAIWALGGICQNVPPWKAAAVQAITNARSAWPKMSDQWLWTVSALDTCNGCLDANNVKLCKANVIPQLEAADLPNTYTFDDGAMVVRTPLSLEKVQPLYHAAKAVAAQVNRLTQTIAPVPGDPNGVLTIILFGSRADYVKDGPFLFGLSSNNGGIYIEQDGTFYTYDRTPAESIYTMEELFRHEFTHYMAERFLIPGLWGATPIYANGRMVWFDEGFAEFCTWSTTDDGVRPRHRLVWLVQQDGADRMTIPQILSATYGDFTFYRYAALLFNYWYQHDRARLLSMIDLVRKGDVPGYDAAIAQLKADAGLQTAYDQFLDDLIADLGALDDPSTIVPPLDALDLATPADVQAQVRKTRVGYLADCTVAAVEADTRFSARGTLSGDLGNQQDLVTAWTAFDDQLVELIGDLDAQGFNNFKALDGRFGRIRWVDYGGQSYPMADYFVEGPLAHGAAALLPPVQQVTTDFHSTRLGGNAVAALNGPSTVQVKLALTTTVHPVATAMSVLNAELEDERDELRNQVFAIRPPYYRNLLVDWDGASQVISIGNQKKYGLRNVVCTVSLA
jgi:microbial collagenase